MAMTLMLVCLLATLVIGLPIGLSLTLSGMIGLGLVGGTTFIEGILKQAPLSTISHYELVTIPMFVLMGEFIIQSKIADKLFSAAVVWLGRTPGGLAIATALFGAGFGAISGSSLAGAATLAATSSPAMINRGYEPKLANGVVAISGTLAMLVPPSIALILYSILTEVSTARMLVAAIIPAIFVTFTIVLTILYLVWREPSRAPVGQAYSWREKFVSLQPVWPVIALAALVSGSLYLGIATPVETSAVGAFLAFCFAFFGGHLNWQSFVFALTRAARTSAMIALILVGAAIFGYAMTLTQATQSLVEYVTSFDINPYVVMAIIISMVLVLGCFLDQAAILVLTVPILLPVILALGFDPIWFGVVFVIAGEVGMVTPPVGLNVYIIAKYTGRPAEEIFAGTWPHVLAHILAIAVLVAFPAIVMYLPDRMN